MSRTGKVARTVFAEEHEAFRETVRKFIEREIAPFHAQWEGDGIVPRSAWKAAGAAGLLGIAMPEAYGGLGLDRRFSAVMIEEFGRSGYCGPGFNISSDIVGGYLTHYGSEEQKQRWLPQMASGDAIAAIAMTEPGGGSDLQAIRTTAIRDGDHYVINGAKTFITNGQHADIVVLAAKTDPAARASGVSLILVEGGTPGFERGRNLDKLGMRAQDTSELFFNDARVPVGNLLGVEGKGFSMLMRELAWERMMIAIRALGVAEQAIETTVSYARERKAFGGALLDMQHNRFKLAERKAQVQIQRVFVDHCLALVTAGELDDTVAAMAKYQATELMCQVVDDCLQMHGGYGFMWDYPICRAYADTRYMRIAGGSNEVMRELIARTL
jgi:acyl-CoA dehydrogenase